MIKATLKQTGTIKFLLDNLGHKLEPNKEYEFNGIKFKTGNKGFPQTWSLNIENASNLIEWLVEQQ